MGPPRAKIVMLPAPHFKRITLLRGRMTLLAILLMPGGLGLSLQAADTVIVFASDWNPQDLRAYIAWVRSAS